MGSAREEEEKRIMSNTQKGPTDPNSLPQGADAYEHLKDNQGRFRTQSLFWEKRHPNYPAPFTLKDREHKGRLSMYEKYMEIGDPTEYRTAIALLGSWKHWKLLTSSKWFEEYIVRWREELKVKFESDRFAAMEDIERSQKGTAQAMGATKWLADRYSTPKNPKRGRPSKAEKAALLKEESQEDKLLIEEAERLGLND